METIGQIFVSFIIIIVTLIILFGSISSWENSNKIDLLNEKIDSIQVQNDSIKQEIILLNNYLYD